jgi:hypothetical protein
MIKHEYTYDIKMFALIRIRAESRGEAKKLARAAAEFACLEFHSADDQLKSAIVDASVHMDDEGGPFLTEIDGEEFDCSLTSR